MATIDVKNIIYIDLEFEDASAPSDDLLYGGGSIENLIIQEDVGGKLPTFKLEIVTKNAKVFNRLNPGNVLKCIMGTNQENLEYYKLYIQLFNHTINSDNEYRIYIYGFTANPNWLTENKIKGFPKTDSLSVMKETISEHFNYKLLGSPTTNDEQNWLRTNLSPHLFMEYVWKHSYIDDENFIVRGITRNGDYRVGDYLNLIKEAPKWKFGPGSSDELSNLSGTLMSLFGGGGGGGNPKRIPVNTDYNRENDFGYSNANESFNTVSTVNSFHEGETKKAHTSPKKSLLAGSGNTTLPKEEPARRGTSKVKSEAQHENYHNAEINNTSKESFYQTNQIKVNAPGFFNYEIMDIAELSDYDVGNPGNAAELSGLHMITKISRWYFHNRTGCVISLSKESLNNQKGDLLGSGVSSLDLESFGDPISFVSNLF